MCTVAHTTSLWLKVELDPKVFHKSFPRDQNSTFFVVVCAQRNLSDKRLLSAVYSHLPPGVLLWTAVSDLKKNCVIPAPLVTCLLKSLEYSRYALNNVMAGEVGVKSVTLSVCSVCSSPWSLLDGNHAASMMRVKVSPL